MEDVSLNTLGFLHWFRNVHAAFSTSLLALLFSFQFSFLVPTWYIVGSHRVYPTHRRGLFKNRIRFLIKTFKPELCDSQQTGTYIRRMPRPLFNQYLSPSAYYEALIVSVTRQLGALLWSKLTSTSHSLIYFAAHTASIFHRAMSDQPLASLSWEVFPIDIWLIIFRAIPDIPTLTALALTNFGLLKIFIRNASSFSFAVLCNEIPAAILPEAIAAWSSSNIKPWSKYRVREFLQQYHGNREAQLSQSWTLNKARKVSKLYQCSRFFASEFSALILSTNPTSGLTPSRLEANRIERSFLRFELYCNLFRKQFPSREREQRFYPEEQQKIYFKYYAEWENEQLACVHDYLFRRLSIPFNDLALHDVEWGKNKIDIVADHDVPGHIDKEYILSLGLAFLQDLGGAHTYERRRELLGSALIFDNQFLHESLKDQGRVTIWHIVPHFMERRSEFVVKPFFQDDDDIGPRQVWAWAYIKRPLIFWMLYSRYKFYNLRVWGFCWWDMDRLIRWGVFNRICDDGWMEITSPLRWLPRELTSTAEQQSKSWKERSRIWDQGGRGWWAEGDESKIIWDRVQ